MAPSQGEPTNNSDSLPTDNIFTVLEVPAVQDSRKRRCSEGDHEIATPTPNKKHKQESICSGGSPEREVINNKSVNNCTPGDISGVSNTPNMHDLFRLMEGISLEVKSLNVRVFDRIATLEKTFAKNVVENMCKMVDGKIQKEIGKVKNELGSEINEVKTKISEVEKACEPLRSAIESVRSDFEKDNVYFAVQCRDSAKIVCRRRQANTWLRG